MKDSRPQGRPFSARTPDKVERLRDAMLGSPRSSARRQALALRLDECSVRRLLHKDLHYYPYKIQFTQVLRARDKSSGVCFRADSFLVSRTSPGPPDRLNLRYQTDFRRVYVESSFHETRPADIDELKHRILECIQRILKEMLQRVMTDF